MACTTFGTGASKVLVQLGRRLEGVKVLYTASCKARRSRGCPGNSNITDPCCLGLVRILAGLLGEEKLAPETRLPVGREVGPLHHRGASRYRTNSCPPHATRPASGTRCIPVSRATGPRRPAAASSPSPLRTPSRFVPRVFQRVVDFGDLLLGQARQPLLASLPPLLHLRLSRLGAVCRGPGRQLECPVPPLAAD
jgi:hypothetical protein